MRLFAVDGQGAKQLYEQGAAFLLSAAVGLEHEAGAKMQVFART